MHILEDLDGISTFRGRVDLATGEVLITLASPSVVAEGVYYPAESFTLSTRGALSLYEALGQLVAALPEAQP